jgi:hypothetical protein
MPHRRSPWRQESGGTRTDAAEIEQTEQWRAGTLNPSVPLQTGARWRPPATGEASPHGHERPRQRRRHECPREDEGRAGPPARQKTESRQQRGRHRRHAVRRRDRSAPSSAFSRKQGARCRTAPTEPGDPQRSRAGLGASRSPDALCAEWAIHLSQVVSGSCRRRVETIRALMASCGRGSLMMTRASTTWSGCAGRRGSAVRAVSAERAGG